MDINYEYNLEIDNDSPLLNQSNKITIPLRPHQMACLNKSYLFEKYGNIKYDIKNNNLYYNFNGKYSVNSNIGILGDIVGYGKTLTALSIVASCDLNNIFLNKKYEKNYISKKNYSYFSYSTDNSFIIDNIIHSTLIIVPRGPVYNQWINSLKNQTTLKFIAIDNLNYIKKNLPSNDVANTSILKALFSQYDVVLIKNTTFNVLLNYYNNSILKKWKRVMVDEAHDIVKLIPDLDYYFLWLISGTYLDIVDTIRSQNNLLYDVRQLFYDIKNINLMLVKCNKDFVRQSFKLPVPDEKYYLCKMSKEFETIKDFVANSVIEKLNANDVIGAIKELGGKTQTEETMVDIISKELRIDISNKEKELEYVEQLILSNDVKKIRINKLDNELNILKKKLTDLTERISKLSNKSCPICMDLLDKPFILKCTHTYCGICLTNWIKNNKNCPECREIINTDDLVAITDNKNNFNIDTESKIYSKDETLLNIINSKKEGKYLVFSKYESGFNSIIKKLNNNNITYAELKGNTSHMVNILNDFRNSKIKVILLNTLYAGSGIDISFATDVIIYHQMGLHKNQAIGRAQRVGRVNQLYIHNLCYQQEMP
jgi:superfamily II DNA or RNA helicase